ncbi:TSUP family transporter [Streptococcus caprae]|uniref:Probable membrane transporter protein n=1 Tax=Streptococcus caprae TaxID=1640501 RepID=A0ABV8CTB2_9STRE
MTEQFILRLMQALILGLIAWNAYLIYRYARKNSINLKEKFWTGFVIGIITDFFDTLGIGTFATTTTFFKATKLVSDDRKIPATMTTAHIIPVLTEALLSITIVQVDLKTLICMAAAAFSGAFIGARVTQNWNTKMVQRTLGTLLMIAALIMAYRMITNPGQGLTDDVRGLTGLNLVIGMVFDFVVGLLMSMGLGNYAPELIFFSLMGISPVIALPVMMLNAGMIMTAGAKAFIESGRVSWPGVVGISVGGVIGVLMAIRLITILDVQVLKVLVIFIALYTGFTLLRASLVQRQSRKG